MGDNTYRIIGLMSGTSLDGLDIAFCTFSEKNGSWSFKLEAFKQVDYSDKRIEELREAIMWPAPRLLEYDYSYGVWLGEQVNLFIDENGLEVDLIASHGHTIHHQPENGFTTQIGSGQAIAKETGIPTIADLRSKDVAYGGQGAPLVPIGDKLLFGEFDCCLNLGGIANISFEKDGKRIAYDIGPANMLLNYLAGQKGLIYDDGGKLAEMGEVDQSLLKELNDLAYYLEGYPKSLGFEWFVSDLKPLVDKSNASVENKMATAVAHEAHQIANAVLRDLPESTTSRLLVTGGGAKNNTLIKTLSTLMEGRVHVYVPEEWLIDYKEAIVFALMGVLRYRNEVNCLSSVTGASNDVSGGVVFLP